MPKGVETLLTPASTNSSSLRTTVPVWVVKQFELESGDSLFWRLESSKEGLKLVVVPSKRSAKSEK
jgi:hypothetical protein